VPGLWVCFCFLLPLLDRQQLGWLLLHSNSICLPQGYRSTNSLSSSLPQKQGMVCRSTLLSILLFLHSNKKKLSICFLLKRVSTATNINPLESIDLPASPSVQALDRSIHSISSKHLHLDPFLFHRNWRYGTLPISLLISYS
jgi:hypothetical protein